MPFALQCILENKDGTMELKSLLLAVCEGTIESYMDLFRKMVEVKHLTILMSSVMDVKYASILENWKMLETIVLGVEVVSFPVGVNCRLRPCPVLPEIMSKFQCLTNLATIHFHGLEMLSNQDIDTISKFNGRTIKEMYLDICSNVDDLCLYDIKVRFQNLLVLAVCGCKEITGTFLQQNYQSFEIVPEVKTLKLKFDNESNPELIINAIELVRTHSRNKVEIIFL